MKKNYSNSINFENLQRMRDYLVENKERIKPNFNMLRYREVGKHTHKCETLGCVLGWGVEAFGWDEIMESSSCTSSLKEVDFLSFSKNILGIDPHFDSIWDFLFSASWSDIDNTLDGAIERLNHVLSDKPMNEHEHYQEFIKTL